MKKIATMSWTDLQIGGEKKKFLSVEDLNRACPTASFHGSYRSVRPPEIGPAPTSRLADPTRRLL